MTISFITINCPECNSEDINKAGMLSNVQRYVCKSCNKYFYPDLIEYMQDYILDYISGEKNYFEKWQLIRIAIQLVRDSLEDYDGEYINDRADQAEHTSFYGDLTSETEYSKEYDKFLSKYHDEDRYSMAKNIFEGKRLSDECKNFILSGLVTNVFFQN